MNETTAGVDQPKRIVAIAYVVAAIVVGVFLEKVLALVFTYARVNDFSIFGDWTLSTVLGFVVAAGAAIAVWRIPKTQTTSLEIALELRRVTWPSLRETRAATIAVIVASTIAAVVLWAFDMVWSRLSSLLY